VKGAYEVLVSMMILIYMIPFLFLFGAAIRLQFGDAARARPGFFRFPGARALLAALGVVGLITTVAAISLSLFPAADEPNKPLAVLKVVGMTALMAGSGVVVFGMRRLRPGSGPARV
jgi:hypothetical protein